MASVAPVAKGTGEVKAVASVAPVTKGTGEVGEVRTLVSVAPRRRQGR